MPNTIGSQNKNDNYGNNSNINNGNNSENNNESNKQNNNISNSSNNNNKGNDKKNTQKLTPHEILELHELLNNEIVSVKRTQLSMPMVQDAELKSFVEEALSTKKNTIQQMENFIKQNIN
jgi:similar to spore coat protein